VTEERWDVFVSYASEDREAVVRPLAEQLEHCGLAVWYDQTQLRVGDSIRRKIDEGLARARYGVVILSPSFFDKHHPEQELDGLAQREQDGAKVILPVWYEVAEKDVRRHSAWLAGRLAAKWEDGIAVVIEQLLGAIAAEDDQQATQLRTDRAIGPQHPAQRRQRKTGQKWEPLAALLPDLEALADGLGEELKGTAPPSTVARNHATILKVAAILEARHIEGPPTGQPVGNAGATRAVARVADVQFKPCRQDSDRRLRCPADPLPGCAQRTRTALRGVGPRPPSTALLGGTGARMRAVFSNTEMSLDWGRCER